MTEANLSIARKVVLCAGLLAGALLSLYPHWRLSVDLGDERPTVNQDLGRAFISSPPLADPASVTCVSVSSSVGIHYARQFTEVAIALLLAFGLTRVLRKPAADRKHDAEARDMHILKKKLGYAGTALAIGVGLFFSYLIVRGIVDALLGSPAQRTRLLTKPILYVCVLAAVTAYVKLRQKYRGENSKAGPG